MRGRRDRRRRPGMRALWRGGCSQSRRDGLRDRLRANCNRQGRQSEPAECSGGADGAGCFSLLPEGDGSHRVLDSGQHVRRRVESQTHANPSYTLAKESPIRSPRHTRSPGHTRIRPIRAAPEGERRRDARMGDCVSKAELGGTGGRAGDGKCALAILLPLGHRRTREFGMGGVPDTRESVLHGARLRGAQADTGVRNREQLSRLARRVGCGVKWAFVEPPS